jgi:uncharacterized protein YoaH (UPF0181 family)
VLQIETSKKPSSKSLCAMTVEMLTSISGELRKKRWSLGINQSAATDGETATVIFWRPPRRFRARNADSSLLKPSESSRRAPDVAGVRTNLPLLRSNKGVSRNSSNERIWWLMAVGVTQSSAAALVKLRCRAAHSSARNEFNGI